MARAFTVVELGKSTPADIRVPATEPVEVIDMSTRAVSHVKAASVSMYRHMLRRDGKSYSILNIQECA
ncbi:MAG: hypothetical protein K0S28_2492 [Paucimonas sp.]|jgi:hypothetical protein|nr:hypothetical protein [Paucimonas sp.]